MGIDLELADYVEAGYRLDRCQRAGPACAHEPGCQERYDRIVARANAARPDAPYPTEFSYRSFQDINRNMELAGMGYVADPLPDPPEAGAGEDPRWPADFQRWRSQTIPGRTGIPAFKLTSNDNWLVTGREIDEALAAYANAPEDLRATPEQDRKWVSWLEWLAVAQHHGGFEAE